MEVDYVHKDSLTATEYVEFNKKNEILLMYNQTLLKENQELKKQLEEITNYYCEASNIKRKRAKKITELKIQQKEFIKYLEDEKDRLIKETSHYYIDSFDRQYAVNETIYDEVDIILNKYKEIIGDDK